jgi:putative transposase
MVRAGVVKHPADWPFGGYCEIQQPPQRYKLIDQQALMEKCSNTYDVEEFRKTYKKWVVESLNNRQAASAREPSWSEAIAVGSERFIQLTKEKLGHQARGRRIIEDNEAVTLREHNPHYNTDFDYENGLLISENGYL